MKSVLRMACVVLALAFSVVVARTQVAPEPAMEISGGANPVALKLDELAKLPQVTLTVTFNTSKGVQTADYTGPRLWDVIRTTGLLDGFEHNAELAKTLLVTASDGYRIAFSIGELSPEFGNATALLALETDGKRLARGFQIVVQGDKRGARAIHDIVSIEMR